MSGFGNDGYNKGEADRPDRPLTARRRAEQRWRLTEPWRVSEKRKRWRKITLAVVLVVAVAVVLDLSYSSSSLPGRDVAGITDSGGRLHVFFYGCGGQRLLSIAIYNSSSALASTVTADNAIWWVETNGGGITGNLEVTVGDPPAGFHTVVAFKGLPSDGDTDLYFEAQTNEQLVHFVFAPSVATGGYVVTSSDRMPLQQYQQQAEHLCS
jgi:hypothetical protein